MRERGGVKQERQWKKEGRLGDPRRSFEARSKVAADQGKPSGRRDCFRQQQTFVIGLDPISGGGLGLGGRAQTGLHALDRTGSRVTRVRCLRADELAPAKEEMVREVRAF